MPQTDDANADEANATLSLTAPTETPKIQVLPDPVPEILLVDEAAIESESSGLENETEPGSPGRRVHWASVATLGLIGVAVLAWVLFQTFKSDSINSPAEQLIGRSIDDLEPVVTDRAIASERTTGLRGNTVAPAFVRRVSAATWVLETDAVDGFTVAIFDVTGPGTEWGVRKNRAASKWEIYRRAEGLDTVVAATDAGDDNKIVLARVGDVVRFSAGEIRMDVVTGTSPAITTIGLASAANPPDFRYFNLYIGADK